MHRADHDLTPTSPVSETKPDPFSEALERGTSLPLPIRVVESHKITKLSDPPIVIKADPFSDALQRGTSIPLPSRVVDSHKTSKLPESLHR